MPHHPDVIPLLCTVKEAAAMLRVAPITIWRLLARGELISVMIGRKRLINVESVKALALEGSQAARQPDPRTLRRAQPQAQA